MNGLYQPKMNYKQTMSAMSELKQIFAEKLANKLNLILVSGPLFVSVDTGLNDDLNGVEKCVEFTTKCGNRVGVVQSLAKWKRHTLGKFNFEPNTGIYTNMNAIRKDEVLSNIHSYYVDQWDWELVITKQERTHEKLEKVVKIIYSCLVEIDHHMVSKYPVLSKKLPSDIHFITSQELYDMYPDKSAEERENLITKQYGAVFVKQIGKILKSGTKHDSRAPDYDDWELNGDILVYNNVLGRSFELSSMGIRVDKDSMLNQLRICNSEERLKYPYHQKILNDALPFTIGGGIGQSRVAMFFLEKLHIGEVQSSIWPDDMQDKLSMLNVHLI